MCECLLRTVIIYIRENTTKTDFADFFFEFVWILCAFYYRIYFLTVSTCDAKYNMTSLCLCGI